MSDLYKGPDKVPSGALTRALKSALKRYLGGTLDWALEETTIAAEDPPAIRSSLKAYTVALKALIPKSGKAKGGSSWPKMGLIWESEREEGQQPNPAM